MLEKSDLVFTYNAVIYKGEAYPVLYILSKNVSMVVNRVEYTGGIIIMAESEKGLPDDLVNEYQYKSLIIENKNNCENYKSNFAYIGSHDKLFEAVDLAYKGRRIYETKKREFIMDVTPYNYVQY